LTLGFFTCGFHIAFVTHLPGEVGLCGLPAKSRGNIARDHRARGTSAAVSPPAGRQRHAHEVVAVLGLPVARRGIASYLVLPPTTFYVFAAFLGVTWLSTVPPTAGIVGKLLACATSQRCSA
jgi:hypothetical protein